MYLDKLNASWTSFAAECGLNVELRITNTTKLRGCPKMYMLEFRYKGARYHLYHELEGHSYHLHIVNAAYPTARLQDLFDCGEAVCMDIIHAFMHQHYEGIQTSVDCSGGLDAAKQYILHMRYAN
ncbi:hypothetical protein [Paenibacillus montanisoli]|uniref:hypothetical protein n=1 Tax=Paenibacillus montanisoli TaxID=2081970 RepID=UPI00140417F6|nr:hypothetical protein [Paenibacillus montanisoli]